MDKRTKRAHRLLDVLTQLQQIEEQKKLQLERRITELDRSQKEVIHALNDDEALHGLFIDNAARLLRSLATEMEKVKLARDEQSQLLRDRTVKVKTAERVKDNLEHQSGQIRQESELRDIIERYVGRNGASLP